ncbi:MAG: hypothetical protein EOO77_43270 [Oxalobacteraceae bacterium]|nr:MAG: hypothetical protein EOO77_43270 [Oxalobacteraceae bacterium]
MPAFELTEEALDQAARLLLLRTEYGMLPNASSTAAKFQERTTPAPLPAIRQLHVGHTLLDSRSIILDL